MQFHALRNPLLWIVVQMPTAWLSAGKISCTCKMNLRCQMNLRSLIYGRCFVQAVSRDDCSGSASLTGEAALTEDGGSSRRSFQRCVLPGK